MKNPKILVACEESQAVCKAFNGWTVDVIAHIFSYLPDEYKED